MAVAHSLLATFGPSLAMRNQYRVRPFQGRLAFLALHVLPCLTRLSFLLILFIPNTRSIQGQLEGVLLTASMTLDVPTDAADVLDTYSASQHHMGPASIAGTVLPLRTLLWFGPRCALLPASHTDVLSTLLYLIRPIWPTRHMLACATYARAHLLFAQPPALG